MFLFHQYLFFVLTLTYQIESVFSKRTPLKKSMSLNRKLKILCLHGLGQNGIVFRNKSGSFRKRMKSVAEFKCIDAPYVIKNLNNSQLEDVAEAGEGRAWFHPDDERHSVNFSIGFKESIDLVEKELTSNGPYDGVLGFSQGAELLGVICCLKARNDFHGDFKFVIFVSGLCSASYPQYFPIDSTIDIPSLHIIGETDKIIIPERSEKLFKYFNKETSQKILHPGGHFLPAKEIAVSSLAFLNLQKETLLTSINEKVEVTNET